MGLGQGSYGDVSGLADYVNVPATVGAAVSHDKSLMGPLSSTIGLEGLYDILEVIAVDAHNARIIAKRNKDKDS